MINPNNNFSHPMRPSVRQAGVALPITLILLFVMTLLGVASLRMTIADEEMVGNTRLREIAFNAAESVLAYVEQDIVSNGLDLRSKVFTNSLNPTGDNEPGDSCVNGYCTASQHHFSSTITITGERWLDPSLDVWNTASKHNLYPTYVQSGLASEGVYTAPKYIVEFLGNYYDQDPANPTPQDTSACWDSAANAILPASARVWPFCPDDPQVVRITALALAGNPEKNARVMLQSTIVFED